MDSNQITSNVATEIRDLHADIVDAAKTTLAKALRIGELLSEQKARLSHGEFIPWVEKNLPFSDRTARNYMKVFRERDRLKSETVSDLGEAYRLLAAPQNSTSFDEPDSDPYSRYVEKYGDHSILKMVPKEFEQGKEYTGLVYGHCRADMIVIGEYLRDQDYVFIEIYDSVRGEGDASVVFTKKPVRKSSVPVWLATNDELRGAEEIVWHSEECEPGRMGRHLSPIYSQWYNEEWLLEGEDRRRNMDASNT